MAKARRMTNTLSVFQAASPLASRGAAPPLPDRRRPLLPDSHGRRCRTATAGAAGPRTAAAAGSHSAAGSHHGSFGKS
jgi:hypothetical protein